MNVNMLKLEYQTIHSRWKDAEDSAEGAKMKDFVVECIKVYNLALLSYSNGDGARRPTERLPGDDAGLLAAMGLIRLHSLGYCPQALLQAVTTLEHLVQNSPFNYEALVTLTTLYTKLGAGWLAAEHYSRLSIKNIQYPTVSWLLSTRISTVYPHTPHTGYKDVTAKANTNSVQHLTQALNYHLLLQESDQQEITAFLDAGQYASLIQAMGNSVYNQLGFSKYMLLVESARIERLFGIGQKLEHRRLAGLSTGTKLLGDGN